MSHIRKLALACLQNSHSEVIEVLLFCYLLSWLKTAFPGRHLPRSYMLLLDQTTSPLSAEMCD